MLLEELIERKSIRGFQQGFQKRRSMKLPKTYQVVQIQGSDQSYMAECKLVVMILKFTESFAKLPEQK